MKTVSCFICDKSFEVDNGHYARNKKKGYNFFCSPECKCNERVLFDKKILKPSNPDDCWIWSAGGRNLGYGAFKLDGKVVDAHRVSWLLNVGEIPDGLFVLHKCDNRQCVNPAHLFLGTHTDNMQDALDKGRMSIPTNHSFPLKHNPKHKAVSNETMLEAKLFIENNPKVKLKEVAKMFSIPYQALMDSRRKKKRSYYNI